jgi:hypothetical protein
MGLRLALVALLAVLGCAASAASGAAPVKLATAPVVPCDDIILDTRFPYRSGGYRSLLGVLAVPPGYLQQVVPAQSTPWRYWRKAGLVVRAGAPRVTVSVPRAWRSRAAITWGNGSAGRELATLAIARCSGPARVGHAYAGGFSLRTASACVPIVFQVGSRRATVRFGIGRRC